MFQAAVEALNAICGRFNLDDDEYTKIILPMFMHDTVVLLQNLYSWSLVQATEIDEGKYLLCRKISEVRFVPLLLHESY